MQDGFLILASLMPMVIVPSSVSARMVSAHVSLWGAVSISNLLAFMGKGWLFATVLQQHLAEPKGRGNAATEALRTDIARLSTFARVAVCGAAALTYAVSRHVDL